MSTCHSTGIPGRKRQRPGASHISSKGLTSFGEQASKSCLIVLGRRSGDFRCPRLPNERHVFSMRSSQRKEQSLTDQALYLRQEARLRPWRPEWSSGVRVEEVENPFRQRICWLNTLVVCDCVSMLVTAKACECEQARPLTGGAGVCSGLVGSSSGLAARMKRKFTSGQSAWMPLASRMAGLRTFLTAGQSRRRTPMASRWSSSARRNSRLSRTPSRGVTEGALCSIASRGLRQARGTASRDSPLSPSSDRHFQHRRSIQTQ